MNARESTSRKRNACRLLRELAQTRLIEHGPHVLSEIELLAIVMPLAHCERPFERLGEWLASAGSLRDLASADRAKAIAAGLNERQYATLQASIELARRHYQQMMTVGGSLAHPRATREFLRMQTDDRAALAQFCAEHDIEHEWLDAETLRTSQVCQGAARHPLTGERVFFNQAHLFHLSSLGATAAEAFSKMYGSKVPRQTFFGDGSEIAPQDLEAIRNAFNGAKIVFRWTRDDVLLLDNMQVAHGRRPFKGPRKVVAALVDPHSEQTA